MRFMRVEPTRLAVLVRHRVGFDDTLPCTDSADPADADAAVADRVLLDDEPLLAVLRFDDLGRAVPEFPIDVFVPQVQRLEDVPVRIDDVVSTAHNPAPFGVNGDARKPNARLVMPGRYVREPRLSTRTDVMPGRVGAALVLAERISGRENRG